MNHPLAASPRTSALRSSSPYLMLREVSVPAFQLQSPKHDTDPSFQSSFQRREQSSADRGTLSPPMGPQPSRPGAPSPAGGGSGRRPHPHPPPRQLRTYLPSPAPGSRLRPRSRSPNRALPARPGLKEAARAAALPRLGPSHWRCSAAPSRTAPAPRRRGQGSTDAKNGDRRAPEQRRGTRGCLGGSGTPGDQRSASQRAAGPDNGERDLSGSTAPDSVHCKTSLRPLPTASPGAGTPPHTGTASQNVLWAHERLPNRSDKWLHKPSKVLRKLHEIEHSSSQKPSHCLDLKNSYKPKPILLGSIFQDNREKHLHHCTLYTT